MRQIDYFEDVILVTKMNRRINGQSGNEPMFWGSRFKALVKSVKRYHQVRLNPGDSFLGIQHYEHPV